MGGIDRASGEGLVSKQPRKEDDDGSFLFRDPAKGSHWCLWSSIYRCGFFHATTKRQYMPGRRSHEASLWWPVVETLANGFFLYLLFSGYLGSSEQDVDMDVDVDEESESVDCRGEGDPGVQGLISAISRHASLPLDEDLSFRVHQFPPQGIKARILFKLPLAQRGRRDVFCATAASNIAECLKYFLEAILERRIIERPKTHALLRSLPHTGRRHLSAHCKNHSN